MGTVGQIAWVCLCLGLTSYPVFGAFRLFPLLADGTELRVANAEAALAKYRRFRKIGLVLYTGIPLVVSTVLALGLFADPPNAAESEKAIYYMTSLVISFMIGAILGQVLLRRRVRDLARRFPVFEECIPTFKALLIRHLGLFGLLTICGGLYFDGWIPLGFVAAGLALVVIQSLLSKREIARTRFKLPLDSRVGIEISHVMTAMGVQPKQLVRYPLLQCNAYAYPDGTVLLSSSLLAIMSDREVAAVVAHELSHVRDKEGRKYSRLQMLVVVPPIVLCVFTGIFSQDLAHGDLLFMEAVALAPLVGIPLTWFRSRFTRPMELKADQDAARQGYGPDLASALEKMHHYVGFPDRWEGRDRWVLTHPELAERTARLRTPASGQSEVTR